MERWLFLPATLERYEELRSRIATIRPPQIQAPPRGSYLEFILPALLPLAGVAVVYRSKSPAYVLPAGAFVIIAMVVCDYLIRRSPHLDERIKKGRLGLILVCLSVALKMWYTATR